MKGRPSGAKAVPDPVPDPATFVPGAFVILTTDPGRSGVVQAGEKRLAGRRMVPVRFANGSVKWLPVGQPGAGSGDAA